MTNTTTDILGYINARDTRIGIPSPDGKGSNWFMEVGQPVLTHDGLLTGFQDALEPYVSRRLLRRILSSETEWAGYNEREIKRNAAKTRPVTSGDRPDVKQSALALPPKITISSKTGVTVEEERTTTNAQLDEETDELNDGTFRYRGKIFTSRAALDTFKRTQQ